MRLACFWLVLLVCGHSQAVLAAEIDQRTRAFVSETIPELAIDRVTLREGLDIIRREWTRRHPEELFPVGLSENVDEHGQTEYSPKLTLKLHDVPFAEAVRYLALQGGKKMVEHHGWYALQNWEPGDGDLDLREYVLKPEAMAALGITKASSLADLQRRLFDFGVENEAKQADEQSSLALAWLPDPAQNRLLVRAFPNQHDEIRGILLLLNRGYKLTKSAP